MIFIATSNATIIASVPSVVSQGSALANDIVILAPFAASTSVTCAFVLPNGIRTTEQLAAPLNLSSLDGIPPIKDELGQTYNAWSYTLNGALTEFPGDVTAQFYFRKSGGGILASTASTFNVQAGVPVELPDEPSQDIYSQILTAISAINQENARQDGQIADLQQYKVSRIFPSDETRVYAADPTGDVSFVLSLIPRAFSIPMYDNSGMLETNDPNAPEKVANKRYVDARDDLDRAYTNNNAVFRVEISIDPQTYVLTATARNAGDNIISQSSVDLPLESMVVGAEVVTVGGVDKLRLTLQNGNTVDIDVSDIVDGLATNEALNAGLALKVNKDVDRAAGQTVVYSQSDSGNSSLLVSQTPLQNALPQYGANGALKAGAPTVDNDAANKRYVDAADTSLKGDIDALSTRFNRTYLERIEKNEKRIINLEQGIPPELFLTDDDVAYSKDVPINARSYAAISMIGGRTRKCTNLIPFPYDGNSKTENNVTFTNNGDGSVTVNATTSTGTATFYLKNNDLVLKAGTYTVSGASNNVGVWLYDNVNNRYYGSVNGSFTFTIEESSNFDAYIHVGANVTIQSTTTVIPMLNEGDTVLPYEPYFEGLRSALVTKVESVGTNLFDDVSFYEENGFVKQADGYWLGESIDPIVIFENKGRVPGSLSISYDGTILTADNGSPLTFRFKYTDGTYEWKSSLINYRPYTTPDNKTVDTVEWTHGARGTYKIRNVMINWGSEILPYAPYVKHSVSIPESVRALDGYGWGINDSCYNYIEWTENGRALFVNRVGVADMGTLNWDISSGANGIVLMYEASNNNFGMINNPTGVVGNIICPKYNTITANAVYGGVVGISNNEGRLYLYDPEYTDVATFKAAMSGVPLYYELAEPIVTDITDLVTADNYIEVEGGGTITMDNEYGYAVPSEITFQLKQTEVTT